MSYKALVCIDIQNDFIDGALANPLAQEAMPTIEKLVNYAKNNNFAFYYTRDTHESNYLNTQEGKNLPLPHCLKYTKGWKIPDNVDIGFYEDLTINYLNKKQFGSYEWADFYMGYDEIVICGFVSSICVVSNALILKALYPEVPITFITDASAGLSPENHKAAIEVMRSCQIHCVTLEEYLKENEV